MPFKLTIVMSSFRYAWSEAYYNTAAFGSQQALQRITTLLSARGAVLGNNASIYSARQSQFPANRQIIDIDVTLQTTTGDWSANTPAVENPTNIANMAILLKADTTVGQKLIYLAGAPEGVQIADQRPPFNVDPGRVTNFQKLMNLFMGQLEIGGWGCRSWKATVPVQAVGLQLGTQTPPLIGVQMQAPQPLSVNQKVLLAGWRRQNPRSPGLSGVFAVQGIPPASQVTPPYVYYLWGTSGVNVNNFKTTGTMGAVSYSIATFQNVFIDKGTTRKRGVRTLGPVGKFSRVH